MAWKGREDVQPEFSQLVSSLNNSRLQQSNNALYQTILQLIQFTQQKRNLDVTNVVEINRSINTAAGSIIIIQGDINNLKNVVVLTGDDETAILPNSRRLLPGDAISFDDTVPNERTVDVLVDGATIVINGSNQLEAVGSGGIQSVDVALANADILALPTTPFVVVPAAGANTYIQFLAAYNHLDLSAGAYTNVDPGGWGRLVVVVDVSNYIGDVTSSGLSGTLDFLLTTATIRHFAFVPLQEPAIVSPSWWSGVWIPNVDASTCLNQPLTLSIDNNGAGNFTGGNAANTWKMTVMYKVVTV